MKLENLPWAAVNTGTSYLDPVIEGKRENGNPVYIGRVYRSIGISDADDTAREIAHRCNVHDDLVAALELAIGAMYLDGHRGQRTYESVRAAIAKARGEA